MIEVKHLTKRYGDHLAVDDLSFTVEKGKIYGFLGPNGAGKSTTMNIITGCLAATSGEVTVGGHDIFEEPKEAKKLIGFLPERPPVYPDRTIKENLVFVARARKIPEKEVKAEVMRVMELTGITEYQNRLTKHLSKGYQQRVGIAQALLGDPEVIILDEPMVGLDPHQIIEIRELIRSLKEDHTVILSSHILSEVQATCEIILIISKGKMVACDTPENLEKMFAGSLSVDLTVEGDADEIQAILEGALEGAEILLENGDDGLVKLNVTAPGQDERMICRELFLLFSKAELPILQMTTSKANLEDVFIELTAEDIDTTGEEEAEKASESENTEGKEDIVQ